LCQIFNDFLLKLFVSASSRLNVATGRWTNKHH